MATLMICLTLLFLLLIITNIKTELKYPTFNLNEMRQSLNYHSIHKRSVSDKNKPCNEGEVYLPILGRCKPCSEIPKFFCSSNCKSFCKTCGICYCDKGYTLDNNRECIPQCPKGCHHGDCIAPEHCQCHPGYSNHEGTCLPFCEEPCFNGTCVAPGTCECLSGFNKSNRNTCKPYCSNGCQQGICIAPENCQCHPGYSNHEGTCLPFCEEPCFNGTCVAPGTCECLSGFNKSNGNTCIPYCSNGCANGSCIAPETCFCDKGWLNEEAGCIPICGNGCGNGTCVAPNTCICDLGFKINDNNGTEILCVEIPAVSSDDSSKYWVWICVALIVILIIFGILGLVWWKHTLEERRKSYMKPINVNFINY